MPHLQLSMVSEGIADQIRTFQFTSLGGTIGRSKDCDWTLNDVDRYISNKHIVISYLDNQFMLTDQSSNGVFINDAASPLGKGNHHKLSPSDRITLGKFCLVVEAIECDSHNPAFVPQMPSTNSLQADDPTNSDSGLLDLISGASASADSSTSNLGANVEQNIGDSFSQKLPNTDSLGLQDILSSPAKPSFDSQQNMGNFDDDFTSSGATASNHEGASNLDPFSLGTNTNEVSPFARSDGDNNNNHASANPFSQTTERYETQSNMQPSNIIPEDWDLGDSPSEDSNDAATLDASQVDFTRNEGVNTEHTAPKTPQLPGAALLTPTPSVSGPSVSEPSVSVPSISTPPTPPIPTASSVSPGIPAQPTSDYAAPAPMPSTTHSKQTVTAQSEDVFFHALYEKLGLPKEYIDTVDKTQFADDIVNVLMTSTQGIMALLAGRSVFKQESRLSMTMIKPQSNNPIKFSIDPSDTLEMLLVKKKPGYMSAQDAYAEALNDIQLHQMAFLSGLQATLAGVVGELSPEQIEQEARDSGQSFIGLKMNNIRWQLFRDKQDSLGKQVNENLNELLSKYFSDAYEAQINSIKKR